MKILAPLVTILLATVLVRPAYSADAAPPVKKVMFIGDSITQHAPAPKLGWAGTWGMAASSEAKDYVHLFLAKLAAAQGGKQPQFQILGGGGGKVTDKVLVKDQITQFAPDLAVVQLGENDNASIDKKGFQDPYEEILAAIRKGNPAARILCLGVWTPPNGSPVKDTMIRSACEHFGGTFVDLHAANADPANKTGSENRFTDPGVNWHPGDRGMQAYASALWSAWLTPAKAPVASAAVKPASFVVEERWDDKSDLSWQPKPELQTPEQEAVAFVQSPDANAVTTIKAELPLAKLKGQAIRLETKVKARNVSDKPQKWNGVKLMLVLTNAEGVKDYPQHSFGTGSFDWESVSWTVNVPDNTVSATLVLGLERVSGEVWFGPLKIVPN